MTRLRDTQRVILSAASQRDDGAVLPLPESLKIAGAAVNKVLGGLKAKGLTEHLGAPHGDDPPPLRITRAGLEAIGVEPEGEARAETLSASKPGTARAVATAKNKGKAKTNANGKACKTTPAEKPTPRAGTQQSKMIALLRRPKGATVEQISAATGWEYHTIRGALSGALKKKLGLKVETTRTREVGPNKTGAKGSSTVYRIVG